MFLMAVCVLLGIGATYAALAILHGSRARRIKEEWERAETEAADGRLSGDVLQKYDDRHWKMTAGRDQAWFMLVVVALLLVLAVIAEIAGSDDGGLFMVFWFIPGFILVLQLLVFLFSGSMGLTSVIEV